jgi:hypothetical protein
MKSKYRFWQQEEVDALLDLYGKMPVETIAKKINKSVGSIYYILNKENIDLKTSFWSEIDLSYLKKYYSSTPNPELSVVLHRSIDAIQLKAASIGLKKDSFWTIEEENELKSMKAAGISYKDMAEILNKTISSVHNKLIWLGLTADIRRWTDDELEMVELMSKDKKYTYVEIARQVKATPEQIMGLCNYRGWNRGVKQTKSRGEEELNYLLEDFFSDHNIIPQFYLGEGLKLDFFIPELNLAWEYDGEQHFEFSEKFHRSEKDFLHQQYLDSRKNALCDELGITLIRVSYKDTLDTSLIADLYDRFGPGDGSTDLLRIKENGGNYSEAAVRFKKLKKEFKKRQKEARASYLQSEAHKQRLEEAREYRKKKYLRWKDIKKEQERLKNE